MSDVSGRTREFTRGDFVTKPAASSRPSEVTGPSQGTNIPSERRQNREYLTSGIKLQVY